jgi:hypothetical protein
MTWGESAGVRFIGTGQDGSPEGELGSGLRS